MSNVGFQCKFLTSTSVIEAEVVASSFPSQDLSKPKERWRWVTSEPHCCTCKFLMTEENTCNQSSSVFPFIVLWGTQTDLSELSPL